jgi:hypothetical protein
MMPVPRQARFQRPDVEVLVERFVLGNDDLMAVEFFAGA